MTYDCFGWFSDCQAFYNGNVKCPRFEECRKDWESAGGRMGGYFDDAVDGKKKFGE